MKFGQLKLQTLLLSVLVMIAFTVSSCLDQSTKQDQMAEHNQIGDQKITVTLGELPQKTGRYVGTYDQVNGVTLSFKRSDASVWADVEMEQVVTQYGSTNTPVMQWTAALDNVVPGANYDFEAKAYLALNADEITQCEAAVQNMSEDNWQEASDCYRMYNMYEPIYEWKNFIFDGNKSNFKLQAGNNALQLRMQPRLKPEASEGFVPYISKIVRPATYTGNQQVEFIVEFKGIQGTGVSLSGKVSATCSVEAQDQGKCNPINEILEFGSDWNGQFQICPPGVEGAACYVENPVAITTFRSILYTIPDNPPDEIRIEFTLSTADGFWNPLGLQNSIWFTITRSTIDQTSELIFMPTVQDISVYYDMSSQAADLSYAMLTKGLTDDIEIYANLEYESSTPLGFPSPYLKIVNTGTGSSTQTLYGRMDKNEIYAAELNLNFVHTPTGESYASKYPLPAYDKPKYALSTNNWPKLLETGLCEHCNLQNIGNEVQPRDWNDYHDNWTTIYPVGDNAVVLGGNLQYSTLESSIFDNTTFKNTSFLGANLRNVQFRDGSDLSGSEFINSNILDTLFEDSLLHGAIFTPDDGLATTQDLPYTNLTLRRVRGDNVIYQNLTTKINIEDSELRNVKMNNNLIYQSTMSGFNSYGEFKDNDVVESTIENSNWQGMNLAGTNIISSSLAFLSLQGANLYDTWFDEASGTTLYTVYCDATTVLPKWNNVFCNLNTNPGILEYVPSDSPREYLQTLASGKSRASYLYEGDFDTFELPVTEPTSIAIEVTSTNPSMNIKLYKFSSSGSAQLLVNTDSGETATVRDDGTYRTLYRYYSDIAPLVSGESFKFYIDGGVGVYYAVAYYSEE